LSWRRNQIAVTSAAFVGFIGFTLVMPFLALYIQQLGVVDTGEVAMWTGITLGVTPAVAALCAPLWGRVADRFGNKVLVQRSLLSFVIVMALMAYATKVWHLFALRAIQGIFAGYGALTVSMVAKAAPREKLASAIGAVHTAQRIAPAVGPVVGGILAPTAGLRATFLVASLVYAIALLLVTVFYEEPDRSPPSAEKVHRATFASVLTLENFVLLMIVIFGLQLVDRGFGPVLYLYLDELGYRSGDAQVIAGILFSVLAISGASGNQLAAVALRRVSARASLAGAAVAAAIALGLFGYGQSVWLLVAAMIVFGLGIGIAMTTAFTAAGAVIPRQSHGTSFGFLTGASLTGLAVGPVWSGLVAAKSIRLVFFVGMVVLSALAVLVRHVMVDTREVESAPPVED
jgi:MFS family permease